MFIMPFAREVRLAQTKPTRAPVPGLSLCPPPLRGSRPLRAAGKRVRMRGSPTSSPRSAPQSTAVLDAACWEETRCSV
jgi:hypothetical protein